MKLCSDKKSKVIGMDTIGGQQSAQSLLQVNSLLVWNPCFHSQ